MSGSKSKLLLNAKLHSRIAPTPSGYLHIGNIYSFVYTWLIVKKFGGELHLRVDDIDDKRSNNDFLSEIFRILEWLGLDYDHGPSGPDQFRKEYSQKLRMPLYREAMKDLLISSQTFRCHCSRKQIMERSEDGQYPGTCYDKHGIVPPYAVRLKTPCPCSVRVHDITTKDHVVDLCQLMKDFIIWRRDDLPAYQLASLVDDLHYGINFIVRGRDLLPSTAAQLYLAKQLGYKSFEQSAFVHHALIMENGQKMSKSQQSNPVREQFKEPKHVYIYVGKHLGLDETASESLPLLLENFNPNFDGNFV